MKMIPRSHLPAVAVGAVGVCAVLVRAALTVSFFDKTDGSFDGGPVPYGAAALALCAALVLCAVFAARSAGKGKVLFAPPRTLPRTFVHACCGFFMLFCAGYMAYTMITGAGFATGSSKVSDFILFLFTVGSAVFFFLKASPADARLSGAALYPLLYLLPVGWAGTRLFVLFQTYSAHAVYMPEKLAVLSLVALCVYFLYEARLARAEAPVPAGAYLAVSAFALVLVPLSALPTLVFTFVYGLKTAAGEPVLALVELSLAAMMWMNFLAVLKEASEYEA